MSKQISPEFVLGWAYEYACRLADNGINIRRVEIPAMLDAFYKDFALAEPPEYPPHHAGILCLKCKTMHSPHEAHQCKWGGTECGWLDKDDGEFATSCGKSLYYEEEPSFKDYPYCPGCGRLAKTNKQ
jgi:hypothetical protein